MNIVSEDTLVAVPDTGSGLRQDDLGRLFEPFYAMKRDGLGMGLPICRSIIEAHGAGYGLSRTSRGAQHFNSLYLLDGRTFLQVRLCRPMAHRDISR